MNAFPNAASLWRRARGRQEWRAFGVVTSREWAEDR